MKQKKKNILDIKSWDPDDKKEGEPLRHAELFPNGNPDQNKILEALVNAGFDTLDEIKQINELNDVTPDEFNAAKTSAKAGTPKKPAVDRQRTVEQLPKGAQTGKPSVTEQNTGTPKQQPPPPSGPPPKTIKKYLVDNDKIKKFYFF